MHFSRTTNKKCEPSIISLINVIFLLLIFFMVIGRVERIDMFDIAIPESTANNTKPSGQSAIIYVNKNGKIAINNDFVDEKDLKTIIATILLNNANQRIVIKADSNLDSTILIKILKIAEEAGGKNISLITKFEE